MSELYTFIAASGIVTALSSVICQVLINKNNRADKDDDRKLREQSIDTKLARIDERLEEHNNYAKKMGEIEKSLSLMQQDIKYIKEGKFAK